MAFAVKFFTIDQGNRETAVRRPLYDDIIRVAI